MVQIELDDATEQPPPRRARRRRILFSAVVVAAIVAVATVAPRSRPDPPPPIAEAHTYFTDTVVVDQRTLISVRWSRCAVATSVSTDAGATWTPYRGPTGWRDCGIPTNTSFEVLGPRVYTARIEQLQYISVDAGATWNPYVTSIEVVDALPPGTEPVARGGSWESVDPATGALYMLPRGPLQSAWSTRAAPDGTLWTIGSDKPSRLAYVDDVPAVMRSVDRGRTWQPTGPLPAIATDDALLVPADSRSAYLVARRAGAPMLYRTADGGATWTGTGAPWSTALAATLDPGGALIVYGDAAVGHAAWASRDGGRSFDAPAVVPVTNPRHGANTRGLIWVTGEDGWLHLTADARTWRRIPPHP